MDLSNVNNKKIVDYNHSNVNLVSSILKYYGKDSRYKSLENLDNLLNKKYLNVCFIIFDGLGDEILKYHSEFGIFNESKIDVIDSIFPPTTVAAISTFESGLAPIEHGWLGWRMYFDKYDKVIDVFTGKNSYVADDSVRDNYKDVIKYKSIYSQIKYSTFNEVECHEVYPSAIYREDEDCIHHQAENITEFFDIISDIINSNDKEKFIYCYCTEPDKTLHSEGTKSVLIKNIIDKIEEEFEKCLDVCDDTIFIITADHGLIDIDEEIYLNDYPKIMECLERYPDIDSRCMNFKIKSGMKDKFKKEFINHFGNYYVLYSYDEIRLMKLFGLYDSHPNNDLVFGDFLAIANGNKLIKIKTDKQDFVFKAAHAGSTSNEIKVPLVIVEAPKQVF